MEESEKLCPHCGQGLTVWEPSPYTGWGHDMRYCDNDECEYFLQGRRKICMEFEKNFAYRYCINPETGKAFPIITWCCGELSLLKGRCGEEVTKHQCPAA